MTRRETIEWIDIEKDEPFDEGLYLICRGSGWVNIAEWTGQMFAHPHVIDDMRDITHWAELPQPPAKKESKR